MTTAKQLEKQVQALTELLEAHGIRQPRESATLPEDRADYIPHGSEQHASFLGLIAVTDAKEADEYGHITYRSPKTNETYRLEDQVTPFMQFPDPMQVARLVLRQKVSSLESGPPAPPPDAPPLKRYDLVSV